MDSWKAGLSSVTSWADSQNLEFDALGLVTFLGAAEVEASVGRLVQSSWVEFLPLLGAFVVASDRFRGKQPGYRMDNLTMGIRTTELAGWFSRWLKAQDFDQTRSIVTWKEGRQPSRSANFWIPAISVGLIANGLLIALTMLSGDWFGFASAISMIISVVVKHFLVQQNRAGIDRRINAAKNSGLHGTEEPAKAFVALDDSKIITIESPAFLIGGVFTRQPDIPNPRLYAFSRWVGWLAFAIHILTIGSAALHTQIYTVFLLISATVLTAYKFGCEDSKIWASLTEAPSAHNNITRSCWVSSTLQAEISIHPKEFSYWPTSLRDSATNNAPRDTKGMLSEEIEMENIPSGIIRNCSNKLQTEPSPPYQQGTHATINQSPGTDNGDNVSRRKPEQPDQASEITQHSSQPSRIHQQLLNQSSQLTSHETSEFYMSEGRQDLFVWSNLSASEFNFLDWRGSIPQNEAWREMYKRKKEYFSNAKKTPYTETEGSASKRRRENRVSEADLAQIC